MKLSGPEMAIVFYFSNYQIYNVAILTLLFWE